MANGKLAGKAAIVTGAARGIGRASALELARLGADVLINDFGRAELGASVVSEIQALGRRAVYFDADVSNRAQDERMIARAAEQFGRIDIVVNNAGKGLRKPFLDMTEEEAQRIFGIIFWGAFHVSQFAARRMVEQGEGGSIIMISSVHAFRPYVNASAYNSAKIAVNQLAGTLAVELARHKIRVNAIEPGWIHTPGEVETFGEQKILSAGAGSLWGRLGRPEEIAKAVAFLASNEDSSFATGAVFRIDGGWVLPQP